MCSGPGGRKGATCRRWRLQEGRKGFIPFTVFRSSCGIQPCGQQWLSRQRLGTGVELSQFSSGEVTECQAQVLSAPSVPSGAVLSPVPLPLCPVCTSSSDASIHPCFESPSPPNLSFADSCWQGPWPGHWALSFLPLQMCLSCLQQHIRWQEAGVCRQGETDLPVAAAGSPLCCFQM